jgi:crotonobetainyl-CoA:carnitine CoA-transferase CaiB-like acyl-CoA transferase
VGTLTSVLTGIRVVDLTVARAGPVAVRMLAEWGATVVRVEMPGEPDGIAGDHKSSDYINLHGNKRLVTLNLKDEKGIEILHQLLADADVIVENFRPPVKRKLGLEYETLAQRYPKLIYGSISGFGQDGPLSAKGAVDQVIQGMAGLMSITGEPEGTPTRVGIAIADMAAGDLLATGILLALFERTKSGQGQWVRVSLLEAMISMLDFQAARWTVDHDVAQPTGNDHPTIVPMGTFSTSDGYFNIAAPNNRLWASFVTALGSPPELLKADYASVDSRRANRDQLKAELQAILSTRTRAEWVEILDASGVPCGPINALDEVFAEPQVEHLALLERVEHSTRGSVDVLRSPLTMSRSQAVPKTASPMPSQDTDEVMLELGYDASTIQALRRDGII